MHHRREGRGDRSAGELMRNTSVFWEKYVRPKIDGDFQGLYTLLGHPHPDGPNECLLRIESNIARLRQLAETAGCA